MPDPGNSGQKSSPCPWCFEQVPWDVFTGPRNTTLNPQSSWGWARKMPFQRGPLSWWATGIYSWRQQLSISSFTKTEQGADREWDWTTTTGQNKMIAYSEEHIQPPSFYCSNLYLFKASIHLGHIAVCRKWCFMCTKVCTCMRASLWVSEESFSSRLCNQSWSPATASATITLSLDSFLPLTVAALKAPSLFRQLFVLMRTRGKQYGHASLFGGTAVRVNGRV